MESIDNEIARHVGAEKEETKKMKQALENQERLAAVAVSANMFTTETRSEVVLAHVQMLGLQ